MSHPNILVFVALFGYVPFILGLFAFLPPRRAVILAYLVAWMFLPQFGIKVSGFMEYGKMSAAGVGVLLCATIFDLQTVLKFRAGIFDLPMLAWCVCPFLSSVHNGLGWYDGVVAVAYQTMTWGLPYLVGRLYFNDLVGLRELAMGIIAGGLIYVPLCWIELRYSPQLHKWVYGYYQYGFDQSKRDGGYRPMVFMQHGLMVAMWMVAATLISFWLWWSETRPLATLGPFVVALLTAGAALVIGRLLGTWAPVGIVALAAAMYAMGTQTRMRVLGLPIPTVFVLLIATAACCHSTGALVILLIGLTTLTLTRWIPAPVWIIGLALLPTIYMTARVKNAWTGENLVKWVAKYDKRSSQSLESRLTSEKIFVSRAFDEPVYGWGGWNRFRAHDEQGHDLGVPDAMWIIALGEHGLIGLTALTMAVTLPMLVLAWKIPVKYWLHPGAAPAAALAVLLGLHMLDLLLNAMVNPIYMLASGGICGLAFSLRGQSASSGFASPSRPAARPGLLAAA